MAAMLLLYMYNSIRAVVLQIQKLYIYPLVRYGFVYGDRRAESRETALVFPTQANLLDPCLLRTCASLRRASVVSALQTGRSESWCQLGPPPRSRVAPFLLSPGVWAHCGRRVETRSQCGSVSDCQLIVAVVREQPEPSISYQPHEKDLPIECGRPTLSVGDNLSAICAFVVKFFWTE